MKNKKLFAILTLVCFMMTLMPVAAFAAPADIVADSLSAVEAQVKSEFVSTAVPALTENYVFFDLSARDVQNSGYGHSASKTTDLYVWVTNVGSNIPVNTVAFDGGGAGATTVYTKTGVAFNAGDGGALPNAFKVAFFAAGNYQVHVSSEMPVLTNGAIASAKEFNNTGAVVEIVNPSAFSPANVQMDVAYTGYTGTLTDGQTAPTALNVVANNVEEETVTLYFKDLLGRPLAGVPLSIQTAGAIDVSEDMVMTSATGKAEFNVSGYSEGTYKVYVSFNKFEIVIEVQVGAVAANTIEATKVPSNPVDILNAVGALAPIEFTMYDVNGNPVDPAVINGVGSGWDKANNATNKAYGTPAKDVTGYVAIVEQPAASKLKNEHLKFDGENIVTNKAITAVGDYTFKVVLDNGNYATATMTVKAFQTPVKLVLDYPATVELGSTNVWDDAPYWLDANGVAKTAKGIELAATGYAVEAFYAQDFASDTVESNGNSDPTDEAVDIPAGTLIVKTDEKYVGSKVTLTAVDERYDLITTATITVADEAAGLAFSTETAEVKVNNKIKVQVVDANGNAVALGSTNGSQSNATVDYVILDKPEGAKVFTSTVTASLANLTTDGYFTMNLTSDKVGTVTVQAVVRYNETGATGNNVVKYYTGTQTFAVGTGEIGKSVVMSIGSNELIVGSKVETMDAKPIVQNSRTFVPFRALAEAFGATVAYDQATSSVTAELNGVKVVMTVGAPVYTVNGVEKTADVAPFISDSRTFVPVRFAAEAFGIEVVPTYNEDGSVADVLFNM